jgi:hypothetical protein
VMPIQAKRCVAKAASGTCDDVERDLVGGRPTPGVPVHRVLRDDQCGGDVDGRVSETWCGHVRLLGVAAL